MNLNGFTSTSSSSFDWSFNPTSRGVNIAGGSEEHKLHESKYFNKLRMNRPFDNLNMETRYSHYYISFENTDNTSSKASTKERKYIKTANTINKKSFNNNAANINAKINDLPPASILQQEVEFAQEGLSYLDNALVNNCNISACRAPSSLGFDSTNALVPSVTTTPLLLMLWITVSSGDEREIDRLGGECNTSPRTSRFAGGGLSRGSTVSGRPTKSNCGKTNVIGKRDPNDLIIQTLVQMSKMLNSADTVPQVNNSQLKSQYVIYIRN